MNMTPEIKFALRLIIISLLSLVLFSCSGSSGGSGTSGCCKACSKGKACGDSCISKTKTCNVGAGCACNASKSALKFEVNNDDLDIFQSDEKRIIISVPVVDVIQTNVFGLDYSAGVEHGITDESGYLSYQVGHAIDLFLGNIYIGNTDGTSTRFTEFFSGVERENWISFAITIDLNSYPYDGIQVSLEMRDHSNGLYIDFNQPVNEFRVDTAVLKYISLVTNHSNLVSKEYVDSFLNTEITGTDLFNW
jgi:hypothetical protein